MKKDEAAGRASADVSKYADILGKVFAKRFGDLVENAKGYADGYALETGFRRCTSRVGVPDSRAAWHVRDAPESTASPKWCLYESFCAVKLPRPRRSQCYWYAESAPTSESFRGAFFDKGLAYLYAARASALVFLPLSAWLAPTVNDDGSHYTCNRSA